MMMQQILQRIGRFSDSDLTAFDEFITRKTLEKNEILLAEGKVCRSVYYILSGAFCQYQRGHIDDTVIDLHIENEWMYNHSSFINQLPSKTFIKAFADSEVIELTLSNLHQLIARSTAFLQLASIFDQGNARMYFFDNSLKPAQKYTYIKENKPMLPLIFPVKVIASYLKMAPETLSRIRATY